MWLSTCGERSRGAHMWLYACGGGRWVVVCVAGSNGHRQHPVASQRQMPYARERHTRFVGGRALQRRRMEPGKGRCAPGECNAYVVGLCPVVYVWAKREYRLGCAGVHSLRNMKNLVNTTLNSRITKVNGWMPLHFSSIAVFLPPLSSSKLLANLKCGESTGLISSMKTCSSNKVNNSVSAFKFPTKNTKTGSSCFSSGILSMVSTNLFVAPKHT